MKFLKVYSKKTCHGIFLCKVKGLEFFIHNISERYSVLVASGFATSKVELISVTTHSVPN